MIAGTLQSSGKAAGSATQQDAESDLLVAHSLRADGFDASEDGTGRGTPLVPIAMNLRGREGGAMPECDDLASIRAASGGSSRSYIAFDCKAGGETSFAIGDTPGALRGEGHGGGHAAVAFQCHGSNVGRLGTLRSGDNTTSGVPFMQSAMQVRRLTPRECERLQGFEPDYTRIPWGARKKIEAAELLYIRLTRPDLSMEEARRLAADGPRYKALGNSMAVPVVRWIGERIAAVDALTDGDPVSPSMLSGKP